MSRASPRVPASICATMAGYPSAPWFPAVTAPVPGIRCGFSNKAVTICVRSTKNRYRHQRCPMGVLQRGCSAPKPRWRYPFAASFQRRISASVGWLRDGQRPCACSAADAGHSRVRRRAAAQALARRSAAARSSGLSFNRSPAMTSKPAAVRMMMRSMLKCPIAPAASSGSSRRCSHSFSNLNSRRNRMPGQPSPCPRW